MAFISDRGLSLLKVSNCSLLGKHIYVDAERQEAAVKKANAELNSDSESEDED